MKSSARFLLGFGIAITVLIIVTVTLVLTMKGSDALLPADTPQGVVQRFLIAVQDEEYEKAYGYLQVQENGKTLSFNDWYQTSFPSLRTSQTSWKATLGKTVVTGSTATVQVFVDVFRPGGPFDNPVNTQDISFQLTKVGDGWFITSRPVLYWLY
jgi:hypothetical protein